MRDTNDLDKRNSILIVDDDAINRKIIAHIFAPYYDTDEADNGRDCLSMILTNRDKYSAVLLDVLMEGMDGIEVLGFLKDAGVLEEIPVFLITSEASEQVMKSAYQLGVMDVISKPVIPFVVLRRVQSVIELFEARKRLRGVVVAQNQEITEKTREIHELNYGMVEALATAIEFRDGETGEHVGRIYDITRILLVDTPMGEGLGNDDIEDIMLASIMHDVGKIAIPDEILNKPARLTKEEFEVMKTHTVQGEMLLKRIPQFRKNRIYPYAADIARHHHERWDGRGYPDGLKGDEITPWAQVVSIADVYDALISERVYKKAFPRDKVRSMICGGECGTFNPKLIECFLSVEDKIAELYSARGE